MHKAGTNGVGGSGSYGDRFEAADNAMWRLADRQNQLRSPASEYPPADGVATNVSRMAYTANGNNVYDTVSTNENVWSVVVTLEHCAVQARVGYRLGWPAATYGSWGGSDYDGLATGKYWRNADTTMKLETGGRGKSKQKNLFCLTATAADRTNILSAPYYWNGSEVVWSDAATVPIPAPSIKVDGKALGSDGKLWRLYADNQTIDVTPKVRGKDYYSFTVAAPKHKLIHATRHPALTETNLARTKLGVGEYVDFWFDEALVDVAWPDIIWNTTGGSVGTTDDVTMQFTAPSNAANVTVSVTVKGQTLKEKFKVFEPSGYASETYVVGLYSFPTNPLTAGAGMELRVYMKPTNVSFYRVWMEEVGEDATGVDGYFENNPPFTVNMLSHKGSTGSGKGDTPFKLNWDNSWDHGWDNAFTPPLPDPWPTVPTLHWAIGEFTWNIPWRWWVEGSVETNLVNSGWQQKFEMDEFGTVTITKFGRYVTRNVDEEEGTSN